jgi:hypothetical protein
MKIMNSRIGKDWRIEWKIQGTWYHWHELIDLCSLELNDAVFGPTEKQEVAISMATHLRDTYYGHKAGPGRVVAGIAVHIACDCCGQIVENILCDHCR